MYRNCLKTCMISGTFCENRICFVHSLFMRLSDSTQPSSRTVQKGCHSTQQNTHFLVGEVAPMKSLILQSETDFGNQALCTISRLQSFKSQNLYTISATHLILFLREGFNLHRFNGSTAHIDSSFQF